MAADRHAGRSSPTFAIRSKPDKYIGLIARHGVFARIRRSRRCPCAAQNGTPNLYHALCGGEGVIYDFQRKLLQAEEDSDVRGDRSIVLPLRVPILDVLKVERMTPTEQGGIKRYDVKWFDATKIKIAGSPLPQPYERMRVSYYFDRFVFVQEEAVTVNPDAKILTAAGPIFDDAHTSSNVLKASGDITVVTKLIDTATGHQFKNYTMARNQIYLADSEPTPTVGKVLASYYYCPIAQVIPSDIATRDDHENWITTMPSGKLRMAFDPWYEVGVGDLFTLLLAQQWRDEVIAHSGTGIDTLLEFDVGTVAEEIIGQNDAIYRRDQDFVQYDRNRIKWLKSRPSPGTAMSVRYSYYPTYRVFDQNPEPNVLENQFYPKIVYGSLYSKTTPKDLKQLPEARYTQEPAAAGIWRPEF